MRALAAAGYFGFFCQVVAAILAGFLLPVTLISGIVNMILYRNPDQNFGFTMIWAGIGWGLFVFLKFSLSGETIFYEGNRCLTVREVRDYVAREMTDQEEILVSEHVSRCAECKVSTDPG